MTSNVRPRLSLRRDEVALADTNILSTFAKTGHLPLLLHLFRADQVAVAPAVYEELQEGVARGYIPLEAAIDLIEDGQIVLVALTAAEIIERSNLPASFDLGERETLRLAQSRGYSVLTNEKHVKNWCRSAGVVYWDLPGILRALWRSDLMTKDGVRDLIAEIQTKDRVVLKDAEAILRDEVARI